MKRKTLLTCMTAACAVLFMMACSPEKDSPQPAGKPPVNPPVVPSTDTLALFADKSWETKKVYKDGVDQSTAPSHSWMIGTSYGINKNKSYSFNIPGFPSAGGTWEFDAAGKRKVNFETGQGPGFKWTIISIDKDKLVVEQPESNGSVTKFEFEN